jgi:2-aminoethylphosphonate-pyruvate transaminase
MNPGPVLVDERVREAMNAPDLCHREPEFADLMERVSRKVTQVCGGGDTHAAVVFTGSGTAALEATVSSAVPRDGKVLVLDNGHYGERLAAIAAVHGISHRVNRYGWLAPIDPAHVEETLRGDPEITHVAMVHHETSTGMLNPVRPVGEVAARHGRSLILDAVSSVGGEILDVKADHVDWCIGSANKCLEGMPGLSFVGAPRARLEGLADIPPRTFYLSLYRQYVAAYKSHAPAFTPAVQTYFAFDAALDLMLAEGVPARHARYAALAAQLRDGLAALNLRLLLPEQHRSATLTAVYLPESMSYAELHGRLKERGFVIYAAQESLRHSVFRIANMGQIARSDAARFLEDLAGVLRSHKVCP